MRKIIKTIVIGDEVYTQDEITKTTRRLPYHVKHAINRGKHQAIFKDEYKIIADQVKRMRLDEEEENKQLAFW